MNGIFDEKGLFVEPNFCLLVVGWPCFSSAVWAAWAQAIGSVLAILAAAWVPARIAKKERQRAEQENAYRAGSLAFVLEPALSSLKSTLSQARGQWDESPQRFVRGDGVTIGVPEALSIRLVDLHILGEAARPIHEAIVAANRLVAAVNAQDSYWQYAGQYVDEDGVAHEIDEPTPGVEQRMKEASQAAERALEKLREVHGV